MGLSVKDAKCTRFDGPPRVTALGFQLKNGILTDPVDLFDDPAFDSVRVQSQKITDYIWSIQPFQR